MGECNDMTPNELIKSGEWTEVAPPPPEENFSYNACCRAMRGTSDSGQLNYKMGHPGVAVVFSSGLGDGTYPVYATVEDIPDWGKRITKIEIIFLDDKGRYCYDKDFEK